MEVLPKGVKMKRARKGFGLAFLGVSLWVGWFSGSLYWRDHRLIKSLTSYWAASIFQNDPEIGYVFKPSAQAVHVMPDGTHNPVRTDRFGFRIPLEASQNTRIEQGGIAGVGCSFMAGHGLTAEETLPYLLGEMIGLRPYNLGVNSYSTVTAYLWLKRHIGVLKPRLIIYGFADFHYDRGVWPIAPSAYGERFYAFLEPRGKELAIHPPLADNRGYFSLARDFERLYFADMSEGRRVNFTLEHFRLLAAFRRVDFWNHLKFKVYEMSHGEMIAPDRFASFMFDRFAELAREHGAKLAIVCLTSQEGAGCAPAFERAAKELEASGDVLWIDPTSEMREALPPGGVFKDVFTLSPQDRHPNAAYNQTVSREIYNAVKKRGWIAA